MKRIFLIICLIAFICVSSPIAEAATAHDITVYVTNTGECYHLYSCSYLKSCNAISLHDAVDEGYRACSRCDPPKYTPSKTSASSNLSGLSSSYPSSGISEADVTQQWKQAYSAVRDQNDDLRKRNNRLTTYLVCAVLFIFGRPFFKNNNLK